MQLEMHNDTLHGRILMSAMFIMGHNVYASIALALSKLIHVNSENEQHLMLAGYYNHQLIAEALSTSSSDAGCAQTQILIPT